MIVYLEGDFAAAAGAGPLAEVAQHRYQFAPGLLVQYGIGRQRDRPQQGRQLVAMQVTLRF